MTVDSLPDRLPVSSYCRRGDCKTCQDVQARCGHHCHPSDQLPPTPAKPNPAAKAGIAAARQALNPPERSTMQTVARPNPIQRNETAVAAARRITEERPRPGDIGLVWEEPPAKGRTSFTVPDEILETLKAHPHRWARIREYGKKSSAASAVGRINRGTKVLGPGWQASAGVVGNGSRLYLRWVGEETA